MRWLGGILDNSRTWHGGHRWTTLKNGVRAQSWQFGANTGDCETLRPPIIIYGFCTLGTLKHTQIHVMARTKNTSNYQPPITTNNWHIHRAGGGLLQWLKPTLALRFQRNKMFLPRSLVKIQYCWEPPWPRGSVLGLRPPGLEFRILCVEDSVISFISPFSGGSPGPV